MIYHFFFILLLFLTLYRRFADVFGLDLADVKTFLDEIPKVPKSAFSDLKEAELSDLESDSGSERTFQVHPPTSAPDFGLNTRNSKTSRHELNNAQTCATFSPLFVQPSSDPGFFNRLRDQKVKLESAYMSSVSTVKGIVRVVNLDFHKSVTVKYTFDNWLTSMDGQAAYMPGSCDGFSDKFVFTIDCFALKGQIGKKVQFCVCFSCSQKQYWDNNNGRNYIFQCFGAPKQVKQALPVPNQDTNKNQQGKPFGHFGMGQSPSTSDDPWQRYF